MAIRLVVIACCLPRLIVSRFRQIVSTQVSILGRIITGDVLVLVADVKLLVYDEEAGGV